VVPLGAVSLLAAGVSPAAATPARNASAHVDAVGSTGASHAAASAGRFQRRARTRETGISLTPSATKPYWACPQGLCDAIIEPPATKSSGRWALPAGGPLLEGGGEKGGFDPKDLQSAYAIPAVGGATQTIAIVDAYGDKTAESDLAKYRERYGLEPCTRANGCFRKVNQSGEEANYPAGQKGWEGETSVDLDMASAACPHCDILLVQATEPSFVDLGEAVNTAALLGATEISNSYGAAEQACGATHCEEYAADYRHAAAVVVASSGDSGYNDHYEKLASPSFPATLPFVVAVGGTSLHKASGSRGWSEEVWNEPARELGTGSGCSLSEPKPAWQSDKGCAKRTDNDVAAVAACATPVSVYSSAYAGWEDFCGTSVSAPFVAGIVAHAGEPTRSLGVQAFYEYRRTLFGVTKGSNGTCSVAYLCSAETQEAGYDGPVGLGTPDGIPSGPPTLTALAPRNGPATGGTPVTIAGTNLTDTTAVKFGQTNATSFTVTSETSITAIAPAGAGTVQVVVEGPAGASSLSPSDKFTYAPTYALAFETAGPEDPPTDVAANSEGDLWVSSWETGTVEEYKETGEPLRSIGGALESPCSGSLEGPYGLAVDSARNLWVTDLIDGFVRKFSPEGKCLLQVSVGGAPRGIALDAHGNVWVSGTAAGCVQELSGEGVSERAVGCTLGGAVSFPGGLAIDAHGHIWLADIANSRVIELGESGQYLSQLGKTSSCGPVLCLPMAVATDASGNILVSSGSRLDEYTERGELLVQIGGFGSGTGQMEFPMGLAVDSKANLWVADTGNGRVQRWSGG
jgi:sugar lactone lactonase YvrE